MEYALLSADDAVVVGTLQDLQRNLWARIDQAAAGETEPEVLRQCRPTEEDLA